jgi:hypothetical protein
VQCRTFGSAASAAIARPTNSGDSDTRKFGFFLARLAPGVFRHSEVMQRGFRAEKAARDGEDGDAMRRERGPRVRSAASEAISSASLWDVPRSSYLDVS